MAGGMSRFLTAAWPSGGQKRKGETSTGEFGTSSTVSYSSRRAQEMVERCCSCTWQSTCSTTGLSVRACKFRNAGRKCTACYCWGKCINKEQLMPSPTTTQGLLGLSPQGADPPANEPRTTTPPIRYPTSLSLREISAARAGGRSASGGVSRRRALREEAKGKGWSRRSDDASALETEEEGWGHNTLTALPRGMQKIGARGLRVDA